MVLVMSYMLFKPREGEPRQHNRPIGAYKTLLGRLGGACLGSIGFYDHNKDPKPALHHPKPL